MNIALIGFKAVGKTYYAKIISKKLRMTFIDIDNLISKRDIKKRSCKEIYNQEGREYFRKIETKSLKQLKKNDNLIIATGGGVIEKAENHKILKSLGKIIHLKDSPDTIFDRISKMGFPGYIDKKSPKESFEKIYDYRIKRYTKIADKEIDCVNKNSDQIVGELIKEVKND